MKDVNRKKSVNCIDYYLDITLMAGIETNCRAIQVMGYQKKEDDLRFQVGAPPNAQSKREQWCKVHRKNTGRIPVFMNQSGVNVSIECSQTFDEGKSGQCAVDSVLVIWL